MRSPKPGLMLRQCRNGHGSEHRHVRPTGEVRCALCDLNAMRARRQRPTFRGKANDKNRLDRLRRDALQALGGGCACCGQARYVFLQIDHIHDDGAQHRRELRGSKTATICREILADPVKARQRYQALCANCNWAKWAEKNHICTPDAA